MNAQLSTCQSVDETARRQFEAAWRAGAPVAIEAQLPPPDDARFLPTLEELVHIELELGWKAGRQLRVEEYLTRFPALNEQPVVARLLEQEYHVRHKFGDRPPA